MIWDCLYDAGKTPDLKDNTTWANLPKTQEVEQCTINWTETQRWQLLPEHILGSMTFNYDTLPGCSTQTGIFYFDYILDYSAHCLDLLQWERWTLSSSLASCSDVHLSPLFYKEDNSCLLKIPMRNQFLWLIIQQQYEVICMCIHSVWCTCKWICKPPCHAEAIHKRDREETINFTWFIFFLIISFI